MQRKHVPLNVKEVSEEGEFAGYASVFGVIDSYGDIIVEGAFARSLEEHTTVGTTPKLLWQHDSRLPIGEHKVIREDAKGLYIEGLLYQDEPTIPEAGRAHALLKRGQVDGISIGFSFYRDGPGYEYDSTHDAWMIREVQLWENSLVTFPANPEARVDEVRTALARGESPPPSTMERALREMGLSIAQAKKFMAGGYSSIRSGRDEDIAGELGSLASLIRCSDSEPDALDSLLTLARSVRA